MHRVKLGLAVVATVLIGSCSLRAAEPARRTENVIVVMWDGFRWQEMFGGADAALMDKSGGGVSDVDGLRKAFFRETPHERRETLLPFVWKTMARDGQMFGDAENDCQAISSNGLKFSYPGYNEVFCGFGDPRITSNAKRENPNLSVLEFLNGRPGFQNRVAAYCGWDVFPSIFRTQTSHLNVHAGWTPIVDDPLTDGQRQCNEMLNHLPHYWPACTFDVISERAAVEHLKKHQPRVLFVGLGETDEWGHGRRYDLYLHAAHQADQFVADLWKTLQSMPAYCEKTTLLLTTDHGRGATRANWTDHGEKVAGAERIWITLLGPDTPALGVRSKIQVTQSQIAATLAQLLGEDFRAASPKAAEPLPDVFGRTEK